MVQSPAVRFGIGFPQRVGSASSLRHSIEPESEPGSTRFTVALQLAATFTSAAYDASGVSGSPPLGVTVKWHERRALKIGWTSNAKLTPPSVAEPPSKNPASHSGTPESTPASFGPASTPE